MAVLSCLVCLRLSGYREVVMKTMLVEGVWCPTCYDMRENRKGLKRERERSRSGQHEDAVGISWRRCVWVGRWEGGQNGQEGEC